MNREETLDLYMKGKKSWNAWAESLLKEEKDHSYPDLWHDETQADFRGHCFENKANFLGFIFPGTALFNDAKFEKEANFARATFRNGANFQLVKFQSLANFLSAKFEDDAFSEMSTSFMLVEFNGSAWFQYAQFDWADFINVTFTKSAGFKYVKFLKSISFNEVEFKESANFQKAKFQSRSSFADSCFCDGALFNETMFSGDTDFERAQFKSKASFNNARFYSDAKFLAVEATAAFTIAGAKFSKVPDFGKVTFGQAPQMNNVDFGPDPGKGVLRTACKKLFFGFRNPEVSADWKNLKEQALNLEARYLALMQLATQGNDREREQLFFRKKCLAKRWVVDKFWHAAFWFSLFYQWFSDFGRSLSKPIFWWLGGWAAFAAFYLHQSLGGYSCIPCENHSGISTWYAASMLSLSRSLPALWSLSGFSAEVQKYVLCLHGDGIGIAFPLVGLLQLLFSITMIFFFLLALRNRFRIG